MYLSRKSRHLTRTLISGGLATMMWKLLKQRQTWTLYYQLIFIVTCFTSKILFTLCAKVKWIKSEGYGGIFAMDISQDDFDDLCGAGKNPLLTAVKDELV